MFEGHLNFYDSFVPLEILDLSASNPATLLSKTEYRRLPDLLARMVNEGPYPFLLGDPSQFQRR